MPKAPWKERTCTMFCCVCGSLKFLPPFLILLFYCGSTQQNNTKWHLDITTLWYCISMWFFLWSCNKRCLCRSMDKIVTKSHRRRYICGGSTSRGSTSWSRAGRGRNRWLNKCGVSNRYSANRCRNWWIDEITSIGYRGGFIWDGWFGNYLIVLLVELLLLGERW